MEWYDIRKRKPKLRPVSIVIGGRGIGKTYSALSFVLEEQEPFIYMRNTDKQMSICGTAFGNPFKKLNHDLNRDITMKAGEGYWLIRENEKVLGYGVALSTFENLRGVDLSDVKYVVFDEFIENRTLSFKQFLSFANFYETVNRNRELSGEPPLICILLSNAQKLANDILIGFNLVPVIENMIRKNIFLLVRDNIYIELPRSAVSEAKKNTALYQMAAGTRYADEALKNEFANDSFFNVGEQPIREYSPLCALDDIYIYRHKSENMYYCCRSRANCREFTSREQLSLFMRAYGVRIREAIIRGKVYYSEFTIKYTLEQKLNI